MEETLHGLGVPMKAVLVLRTCEEDEVEDTLRTCVADNLRVHRERLDVAKQMSMAASDEFVSLTRQGHKDSFTSKLAFRQLTNSLQYRIAATNATVVSHLNSVSMLEFVLENMQDVIKTVRRYQHLCLLAEMRNAENYKLSEDETMWSSNHRLL